MSSLFKNFVFLLLIGTSLGAQAHGRSFTVSGISSGAYLANQIHYAHNSDVSGVALIAGGLYYCSMGLPAMALNGCMKTQAIRPSNSQILNSLNTLSASGLIDSIQSTEQDRLLVVTGTHDTIVESEIVLQAADLFLRTSGRRSNLKVINDLPVGHAFPTNHFGNSCATEGKTPFISACKFDGAKEILSHLHGPLRPAATASRNHLFLMTQVPESGSPADIAMADYAVVYVPKRCQRDLSCPVHIALHGCAQTREQIGDLFFTETGYNEWAESNDLIILYPQARVTQVPINPKGCWDWYGYSSNLFHTQKAPQIQTILNLVRRLQSSEFDLERRVYNPISTLPNAIVFDTD
jgi:poly(3-hydroxybutyrate) depolymerase